MILHILAVLGVIYLSISIAEKIVRLFGYKKIFAFFKVNEIDIKTERETNQPD